jgi:hypothetical protein
MSLFEIKLFFSGRNHPANDSQARRRTWNADAEGHDEEGRPGMHFINFLFMEIVHKAGPILNLKYCLKII